MRFSGFGFIRAFEVYGVYWVHWVWMAFGATGFVGVIELFCKAVKCEIVLLKVFSGFRLLMRANLVVHG